MARLRFPGRPGYRFDRLGVRYGADEARNVNDPSLAIVAYIHYGLRQFRELFGESDEEEEFDGFSAKDVKLGQRRLEKVTSDLVKQLFSSDDDNAPVQSPTSTRFSKAQANLEALPASERTRSRIKTVVRKSYKDVIKSGLAKPSKSHVVAAVKEIERMKVPHDDIKRKKVVKEKRILIGKRKETVVKFKKAAAIRVKLKSVDPSKIPRPRGRPPKVEKNKAVNETESPRKVGRPKKIVSPEIKKVKKKVPVKVVCVPKPKQTDKKLAKQLLEKAKKGRTVLQNRLSKPGKRKSDVNVPHTPKPKKEFVLPTVSSRSSRVIIPNKRFIEEDVYYGKVWKKPKLDKTPETPPAPTKSKDSGSAKKSQDPPPVSKLVKSPEQPVKDKTVRKKKTDGFASPGVLSPVLHPKGGNSVSLFSSVVAGENGNKSKKSLIVEGKRQRKPSLKMRMKKGQIPRKVRTNLLLDMDESSSASQESSRGSSEASSKSVDLFPQSVGASAGVSVFSRAGPMSLPGIRQRSDGKGQDSLAAKRSGDNILRKAKLQLNRVAVNRSKAALARSLKAQMKKEAKQRQQLQEKSLFSPQSPTSPLALSPISGSRAFIDIPGSPPPRPLFDNNNLPLSPEKEKPGKEKKASIKRGSHISPKVMSSLTAKLARPLAKSQQQQQQLEYVEEEEGAQPPREGADSRGPRIKHVCRRAAMVLRKPVAKFPSPPSLRLSALPNQEKEKILQEESQAHGEESSDDERPMEEIIRNASTQESTVIKRSPVKAHPPTYPFTKTGRRRKVRCRECKGCLSQDCGICVYCLDKPKFGGRSVMKQACVERKCSNPKYAKVTTTFVLRNIKSKDHEPDDDNSQRDGDGRPSFSSKSSHNSTGGAGRRLPVVQDGDSQNSGPSNTPPMSNAGLMDGEKSLSLLTQARRLARAKEKAVTSQKTSSPLLKPISPGSHRWSIPTAEAHRIKADFMENFCVEEAWQQGMALTMLAPACVRTICYLCGSAGKHELIYCMVCCEPFHSFCLDDDERPEEENMENWCCRRCQFCNVCGHQNHLLRCDRCQSTYHPECLGPSYPTRPSKKNIWVCTKCVKCKSCGATTPGVGTNAMWTYDFSLCYDCGRLMDKGNFCPICHKCYTDDDWESKMIQCVSCESWVHAKCEELSDEMYQLLSYLPEDVHYTCRICTSERPAPWERLLKAEFVASLKTVLYNLLGMKCAQHLVKIDEKKERRSSEKRKSSPKGRGSPGKSTTPVSMVTEAIPQTQVLSDPNPVVTLREATPVGSQVDTNLSGSKNCVPSETACALPHEQLSSNSDNSICDSAVPGEKDLEISKLSLETEGSVGSKVTDTERNIFKLIDECLMGDKMAASLCSDPQIGEDEQLRCAGKPGSDCVSMETDICERSGGQGCENTENLGVSSEEMNVDTSLQDEDQELLSYLRSCGESPEKENVTILDKDKTQESVKETESVQSSAIISEKDKSCENQTSCEKVEPDRMKENKTETDQTGTSKDTNSRETTLLEEPVPSETPPLFVNTPDSLLVQVDSAEKLQDSLKSSDFELLCDGKSMQAINNETPKKSVPDMSMTETPESDTSTGKKKKCNRQFPPDFESIRIKLDEDRYTSVEEFSEDMVHIIQTALSHPEEQTHMRKKFNNSVRSVFVKQMEKCFPWFNINTCKLWEHNKNLPESMLPDAVLPPSDDHTYAQWLEREDPPLSPQPSPFKKIQMGSVKRTIPMSSLDGDSETSSVVAMSDYGGDDLRQCLLCSAFGDDFPDEGGRLLYIKHDDWVHVNCALWSAEVFEESDGTLQNVHIAVVRGRQMRCDHCGKSGATVGCCNRGCSANYHFKCARADKCTFQEDKKVYCKLHTAQVDGEIVEEGNFRVLRRVCIDTQGKYNKKTWNKGVHPSVLNILIGSCTIESLGHLGPLSDVKGCLLPIDFMCTRVYWSTQDARRRCVYTCRIVEVRPNPLSPEMKISDMRIVHDESHPDFVPMDKLNQEARTVLHLLSPNSAGDVMIVSEASATLTPELSLLSVQKSASVSMSTSSTSVTYSESFITPTQKSPSESQAKFDLNLLSPNTLKYLSKADVEKYLSRQSHPTKKSDDDDFGNLSKMVDRLNQAACRSNKRAESTERNFRAVSPPTMPRIKRSSSCDIPPYGKIGHQNTSRPVSPVSVPSERPASVAAMPIRIKVKVMPTSVPVDQPVRISITPHRAPSPELTPREKSGVIVIDEDSQTEKLGSQQGTDPASDSNMTEAQDNMMMSPEQEIAQKVLESVPPEILEGSSGQTVVIMTDSGDMSEEEVMMLAQAALEEQRENDQEGETDSREILDMSNQEGDMGMETVNSEPVAVSPEEEKVPDVIVREQNNVIDEKIGIDDTESRSIDVSSSVSTTAEQEPVTPSADVTQPVEKTHREKKTLSPTSGTIDRKVVEQQENRVPIYKEGMLIGWKINLEDLSENAGENGFSVCEPQEVKKEDSDEAVRSSVEEMKSEEITDSVAVNTTRKDTGGSQGEESKQNDSEETLSAVSDGEPKNSSDDLNVTPVSHELFEEDQTQNIEVKIEREDINTENYGVLKEIADGSRDKGMDDGRNIKDSAQETELEGTLDNVKIEVDSPEEELQVRSTDDDRTVNEHTPEEGETESLPKSSSKRGSTPLKTYPLRRTSQRLIDHGTDLGKASGSSDLPTRQSQELPLHDKIAQKIKAESLAKSSPGVKGPFKCLTCKRLYRTKESFNTHVQNCDFEVSTSEEEEEDEPKTRYPVRSRHKSLESQGCVVKLTDIRNDSKFEKYGLGEKDTPVSPPAKRGRGRPPKKKRIISPQPKPDPVPDSVDVSNSDDEYEKSPDPRQTRSGKWMSSRRGSCPSNLESPGVPEMRHSRQTKRVWSPTNKSESKTTGSPESCEPPAKRGRGRPQSKDSYFVLQNKDSSEKEDTTPESSPLAGAKRSRGRPRKQDLSHETLMEDSADSLSKQMEITTPKKNKDDLEETNLSPEFRLCEVTGMLKNKSGKVKLIEGEVKGEIDLEAAGGKDVVCAKKEKGASESTDCTKDKSVSEAAEILESKAASERPRKTVFNHEITRIISPLDVITDLSSEESLTSKPSSSVETPASAAEESASVAPAKTDSLKTDPAKSAKVSPSVVNCTSKVASILQNKSVAKPGVESPENQVDVETSAAPSDVKVLGKDAEHAQEKVEEKSKELSTGDVVESQCSHFIDKEKSTKKVQYYVVYPPNAKNMPEKNKESENPVYKEKKQDKNTAIEPQKTQDIVKSKLSHTIKTKPQKNSVKATKPILPGNLNPCASITSTSTITNYINSTLNQPAPAFPQPLVIPQATPGEIRQPPNQQRNIFDALQSQPGVSIIGSPSLTGVHSSNVLESAVAHLSQSGMLSASLQTSLQQIRPQIPQPLTINTNPQTNITTLPLPQGSNVIPNIIQQPTSSVLTASLSQIPQPQFQTSPILQSTQTNLLRASLPVSQSTIIHSSPTLIQSGLLPQQQISPVAQPNVMVQPNQQVLPTNLISQLGSLLPGQLTPQQATVVSRLNLQHQQQRGMEYMGSFLLDSKAPQPFASVAQTPSVLTPSLTPQQTQQIMNVVSGGVMNKDLTALGTVLNQSVVSSQAVSPSPQISSALASLGVKTITPVSVVKTKSDTILHSNLVRHLPDGCKTVVCSPSDAVTMLKRILPVSKERSTSVTCTTVTVSNSLNTVSPPKSTVSSPNLRNILNDSPLKTQYPSTAAHHESTVRPHQIIHRPGGPLKGFSVLKKILKPAILHRKKTTSFTMTALKRHLALSPEKNGIIQGQISGKILNSLESHMQDGDESTPSASPRDAGHSYTKAPSLAKDASPSVSTCRSAAGSNSSSSVAPKKQQHRPNKKKPEVKGGKGTKNYKKIVTGELQRKVKPPGVRKRKSPLQLRNIHEKYKGAGAISHPLIHHQKEVMSLPQAELEEEVRETPMMPYFDINNQKHGQGHLKDEPRLVFEITSDDGFHCRGETMEDAWRQVTEKVQDARSAARMKALSYVGMNSANMFGLNNNTVVYLMEQLFGAKHCNKYSFAYFQHEIEKKEEEPTENPSGCIRCEPFMSRKPFDMFSFLMSQYRSKPKTDIGLKNVEMIHKSQRRATSMDLPMAMRFRKLQEHAKEAVGVYRSHIHGRGLFCKRNIDSGEMVIEYAGEVIRASLTDKREKYYESKGIGCYMFRIDDFEVVDATMHGSAARFINHSCEPNCYSRVINVDGKKHIVIFAMRPISKGEELTYDYKFPIEEVKIPCSCGSKKCRKYLN